MIYLWLRCFELIRRREGFRAAYYVMVVGRRERSKKELTELLKVLESISEIDSEV